MQSKPNSVSHIDRAYDIYALIDPRDSLVYYIGISVNAHVRFYTYLNGQYTNREQMLWFTELSNASLIPELKILETIEASESSHSLACEREQYWIEEMARCGNPLLNKSGITRAYTPAPKTSHINKYAPRVQKTNTDEQVSTVKDTRVEPKPKRELLTVAQVAKELGVHVKTVRAWIDRGELPALDIGRGFKVRRDDLDAFLETRRIKREPLHDDN